MLRLKELRKKMNFKQADVAKLLGVTQSAYSSWELGKNKIRYDHLSKLAEIYGVSVDYILGEKEEQKEWKEIPVVGHVRAGLADLEYEELLGSEEIPPSMAVSGEYFALRVRGNSMYPRIQKGDTVIVRRQSVCDSGDIAVVEIDGGSYTVKKIRLISDGIILIPLNREFDPIFYSKESIKTYGLRIVGKVVEVRCRL